MLGLSVRKGGQESRVSALVGMERQISYRHASSSSGGIHALTMKKPPKLLAHPLPNSACLQRDLMSISFTDLLKVAKQLKHAGVVTTLRLFVSLKEQHIVNQRFSSLDRRTTDAVFEFTRALSRAIEGWMHDVEIGLSLWIRDLKILSDAFGFSKTLRRLSFANSGLGDVRLEILAGGLRDCMPLQTLDLSGCALTDASVRCVAAIVKGHDLRANLPPLHASQNSLTIQHRTSNFGDQWRQNLILWGLWSPVNSPESAVTRKAELEWKSSLRKPMSRSSSQDNHFANRILIGNLALAALDLSHNAFTDLLPEELCVALRMGAPLHALNLRCNDITRVGAKFLLDVMQEFNLLRLVDLRGNGEEKLLGVLENGEHYTSFSTFQAPFWLESMSPATNYRSSELLQKKRDSETVRLKHSDQQTSRSFVTTSLVETQTRSPSAEEVRHGMHKLSTSEGATVPFSSDSTQDSDEVGANRLRMQPPVKKGRPQTAPKKSIMTASFQENSRPNTASNACTFRSVSHRSPSWNRDYVCKHLKPPDMIDPPRLAVAAEPPKMFTNELYEVDTHESTPANSAGLSSIRKEIGRINGCFSSLRNTPRRSCAERANNKRKIPDCQRRRLRRTPRTSWKSPPPVQIARSKYLNWKAQHQKQSKQNLPSVVEEQSSALLSSEEIKKEVEWQKFVTEMTETLLTLRDGLDRLIGPVADDDKLSVAQQAASKLPQNLLGSGMFRNLERSCQGLDSQVIALNQGSKKAVQDRKLGSGDEADVRQPHLAAEARKRTCNTRMRF